MSQTLFIHKLARTLRFGVLACLALRAFAHDEIRIVTEELPPYNMTQDGQITGMSTEVVQAVLKEVGMSAPIQSMPWARAYDIALNSENTLIYSITRTRQRENLFKWVGDIAPVHWGSKPKSTESLRSQIHSCQNGFQINRIVLVAKSVVPQEMQVLPRCW